MIHVLDCCPNFTLSMDLFFACTIVCNHLMFKTAALEEYEEILLENILVVPMYLIKTFMAAIKLFHISF